MKMTTIKLTQIFKEWIASLGNKGETYETILKRELKYKPKTPHNEKRHTKKED